MPVVTDELWNAQGVSVKVTYNTNAPDNITRAVCTNSNPFAVTLRLNWNSKPPTDITVPAGQSVTKNPTAAEQADLNSFSVIE